MKHYLLILFWGLILGTSAVKADGYPVTEIPENMKKDAYAVVRFSSENFKQLDVNNGVYKATYVITVLDEKGRSFADFLIGESFFEELKNFSGEIINASGKTIKKISKKDLTTTAYSSNLAADDKRTFYECYAGTYPFTVKYEYEVKTKNGILIYPSFNPVPGFNVSLEKSEYSLQLPAGTNLRYKNRTTLIEPKKSSLLTDSIFVWEINQFEAINYEPLHPGFQHVFPSVLLSPAQFCVNNYCGDMSTWESFGKWQAELLKDREKLSPTLIEKIKNLISDAPNKREKVKRIYEFMQNSTHYVSIQLGIGGWQPMPAGEVEKTGFGDCKALSNYMRAMLLAVDIPSYYTVINMGSNKRFFPDFPSFNQANHVILMVPLETDSVWLECTSQTYPFGYIHSGIAGHDALAVESDKSFFCTLPDYPDKSNLQINKLDISVNSEGAAHLAIKSNYQIREYEEMHSFMRSNDKKEEVDALAGSLKINKPQIENINKKENRSGHPSLDVSYILNSEEYASKTGSRLFIPLNPIRTSMKSGLSASTRKLDIYLGSGFVQSDTISIQTPDGYELEVMPKTSSLNSDYGSFSSQISLEGNKLIYTQQLYISKGKYPAEKYEDFRQFLRKIEVLQSTKASYKKKL